MPSEGSVANSRHGNAATIADVSQDGKPDVMISGHDGVAAQRIMKSANVN